MHAAPKLRLQSEKHRSCKAIFLHRGRNPSRSGRRRILAGCEQGSRGSPFPDARERERSSWNMDPSPYRQACTRLHPRIRRLDQRDSGHTRVFRGLAWRLVAPQLTGWWSREDYERARVGALHSLFRWQERGPKWSPSNLNDFGKLTSSPHSKARNLSSVPEPQRPSQPLSQW